MCRCCPICGEEEHKSAFPFMTIWNKKKYTYIQCRACKTTYVNPYPNDSDFELMYAKAAYHDEHYHEINVEQYRSSIEWLSSLSGNRKTLLDFGCGNGAFLLAAKQAGFICKGVEYDSDTIKFASNRSGVEVKSLNEIISSEDNFEIIHLGDVFEHLPRPEKILSQLDKILAPNGVFFIEGPLENNPSLVYFSILAFNAIKRFVGIKTISYSPPTHLVRTNHSAQKHYFADNLDYKEIRFEVYETGWPYYCQGDASLSISYLVKRFIGRLAIILSKLQYNKTKVFGNRFYALYKITGN